MATFVVALTGVGTEPWRLEVICRLGVLPNTTTQSLATIY